MEHLTSLPKMEMSALSRLTTKEYFMYAYSTSLPSYSVKYCTTVTYNVATSLGSSSPDGVQHSEQQHATVGATSFLQSQLVKHEVSDLRYMHSA